MPEQKHYPRPYEIFSKEDRPDRYDPEEDQYQDVGNSTFGSTEGGDGGDDH